MNETCRAFVDAEQAARRQQPASPQPFSALCCYRWIIRAEKTSTDPVTANRGGGRGTWPTRKLQSTLDKRPGKNGFQSFTSLLQTLKALSLRHDAEFSSSSPLTIANRHRLPRSTCRHKSVARRDVMGYSFEAICNRCGTQLPAHLGDGFRVASFHCGRCGAEKMVHRNFEEIIVHPPEPCSCGGTFSTDAVPRCPECASDDWRTLWYRKLGVHAGLTCEMLTRSESEGMQPVPTEARRS